MVLKKVTLVDANIYWRQCRHRLTNSTLALPCTLSEVSVLYARWWVRVVGVILQVVYVSHPPPILFVGLFMCLSYRPKRRKEDNPPLFGTPTPARGKKRGGRSIRRRRRRFMLQSLQLLKERLVRICSNTSALGTSCCRLIGLQRGLPLIKRRKTRAQEGYLSMGSDVLFFTFRLLTFKRRQKSC